MSGLPDNAPRRAGQPGVESWFLRANHPTEPRALWLKATTLATNDGTSVAEAWCSVFDGDETFAVKRTQPAAEARFEGDPISIDVAECSFALDPNAGHLRGNLQDDRGALSWELKMRRLAGPLGDPLCMLPTPWLVDAPLPRNKFLTPAPALAFDGHVMWNDRRIEVDGWWGSQGHNWGAAHAVEYAWAQVLFPASDGEPHCFAEGVTGRIELAGMTSPRLSLLTVRRDGREYRFDRIIDLWNQKGQIDFPRWSLSIAGPDGEAVIAVEARPERMVCLGYHNPDGTTSYCLNSKTAAVTLRVNPTNEDGFECVSENGGALEFLQPTPEPRVRPVV